MSGRKKPSKMKRTDSTNSTADKAIDAFSSSSSKGSVSESGPLKHKSPATNQHSMDLGDHADDEALATNDDSDDDGWVLHSPAQNRPLEPIEQVQATVISVLHRLIALNNKLDDPKYRGFGTDYKEQEQWAMQVFHPKSEAKSYKNLVQQHWRMKRKRRESDTLEEMHIYTTKDDEKEFVTPDGRSFKCDSIDWKTVLQRYLDWERTKTPFSWTGVETRVIPDSDPRIKLRGQIALHVSEGYTIEAGTVIGPYVSLVSFEDEKEPSKTLSEDLEEERFMFDFQSFRNVTKVLLEEIYLEQPELNIRPNRALRGDGHKAGCCIRAANDYHFDPINFPQGCAQDYRENCIFVECCHMGWPYVFLVAKYRLHAGEELLVDYGENYWGPYGSSALKLQTFRDTCINSDSGVPKMIQQLESLIEPSLDKDAKS